MKTTTRTFGPVLAPAFFLLTACLFCWGQTSLSPSGPLLSPPAEGSSNDSAGFSNFQNTPIASILDVYEQISGKHLIRDANINSIPPVSINATGVSREEFLRLVESTLLLNGVAIVPVDDHTAKVVTMAGARNPPQRRGEALCERGRHSEGRRGRQLLHAAVLHQPGPRRCRSS